MSGAARPQRGEIWLVYTPGQPHDPHQPRPALVISNDGRNRRSDDVVVIPIFSRGQLRRSRVVVRAGMGGIRHDSVLFCEEITTLHHDFLVNGPFGPPLPARLLKRVLAAVQYALT